MVNDSEERTRPGSIWRRMVASPEGKILIAGALLGTLYLVAVLCVGLRAPDRMRSLLTMTGVHIVFGRAAGMSTGYTQEFGAWVIIVANMVIETFAVLIFYPLFVFSYRRLIVIGPLRERMERTQRKAEAFEPKVMKYGIPGLLIFVWFPFWLTGPLVGCIIGFLIGLRPALNLSIVLGGTYLAIFCWGVALKRLYERLEHMGPYVPFVFVGFIMLVAIGIRVRLAFSRRHPSDHGGRGGNDGGTDEDRENTQAQL